jgi:hypothetical protein
MLTKQEKTKKLNQLSKLLERINQAMLGADYVKRNELTEVKDKVIEEIKRVQGAQA